MSELAFLVHVAKPAVVCILTCVICAVHTRFEARKHCLMQWQKLQTKGFLTNFVIGCAAVELGFQRPNVASLQQQWPVTRMT